MNSCSTLSNRTFNVFRTIIFLAFLIGQTASSSALAVTGPQVGFELSGSSGLESAGAAIDVVLSQTADTPVTVDFAVIGGTAAGGGVDYTGAGHCRFDLDRNGEIDFVDLAAFVDGWLLETPAQTLDENGDGQVNFRDFARLASYWLETELSVDIAGVNSMIDFSDISAMAEYWLVGPAK